MPSLPKLKVTNILQNVPEEIRDFEQGKYLPFCQHLLIVVEDQPIQSYEELVQLAAEDCHKDKEFLKVMILPILRGG